MVLLPAMTAVRVEFERIGKRFGNRAVLTQISGR
jgi:hypothetical protein